MDGINTAEASADGPGTENPEVSLIRMACGEKTSCYAGWYHSVAMAACVLAFITGCIFCHWGVRGASRNQETINPYNAEYASLAAGISALAVCAALLVIQSILTIQRTDDANIAMKDASESYFGVIHYLACFGIMSMIQYQLMDSYRSNNNGADWYAGHPETGTKDNASLDGLFVYGQLKNSHIIAIVTFAIHLVLGGPVLAQWLKNAIFKRCCSFYGKGKAAGANKVPASDEA